MNRKDLLSKCAGLNISTSDDDTIERLELLIKGAESQEVIDKNIELQESVDTLTAMNDELQASLEVSEQRKSVGPNVLPIVSHKSKNYQLAYPSIRYNGKIYSAEQVAADKDIIEELIKIKSGMLTLIKKK